MVPDRGLRNAAELVNLGLFEGRVAKEFLTSGLQGDESCDCNTLRDSVASGGLEKWPVPVGFLCLDCGVLGEFRICSNIYILVRDSEKCGGDLGSIRDEMARVGLVKFHCFVCL